MIALSLTACQPQASAHVTPSSSPAGPPGDLIYVQDPSAPRMLEMDWSGKVQGSVSSQGFSTPSPDGSRFFRATDRLRIEDWRGHAVGALDADPSSYGLGIWADDGKHFCGIVFPSGSGPDAGNASLWIGAPDEPGRVIARVGKPGSQPGVVACSIKNNRAIVAGGLFPHLPWNGNRQLLTAEVQVVNLSTGAMQFERVYPMGDLGAQGTISTQDDWVLVAASPDARYIAENGILRGTVVIREVPTGKPSATLRGSVLGFNSDGSLVVLDAGNREASEVQVVSWLDQKVLWHGPGAGQSMLARPNSRDVMIGVHSIVGDDTDLIAVGGEGMSHVVSRNLSASWPCPCPIGV